MGEQGEGKPNKGIPGRSEMEGVAGGDSVRVPGPSGGT